MTTYDAIVLGTGGVGSAAMFHLARRGLRVLGLDRFEGGHDRGSSHGQTRIIRQAYFEHSDYVPLLRRAYELWPQLEEKCGEQLYHEVGLLEIGPRDGIVLPGVMKSAREHNLEIDELAGTEVSRRFPGFVIPDGHDAVFEKRAGYLLVEQCVLAHLNEAKKLGADLRTGEAVTGWKTNGSGVTVQTESSEFNAGCLVITAGAWASQMLTELGIPLRVVIKHLHWYANDSDEFRKDKGCPTFFCETDDGSYFYGLPQIDDRGLKIAEHSGGSQVNNPLTADRQVDLHDRRRVEEFLVQHLPGVSTTPTEHTTCFYTLSPDEHFIVDRHPQHKQIVFAAGLSGHGFKFSGVLGDVLSDLVIDGKTDQSIDFLRCDRFV